MPYQYYPPQYQPGYYPAPVPDQLAQLRQNQFQPNMQQGFQQTQQPAQPTIQSMIWVNGLNDAKNYLIAPNSAVTLWDSNSPVVYLKQADASGKPSMKIYDLVERNSRPVQAPIAPAVEYATKDELAALAARLDALTAIKDTSVKPTTKKTVQKEDAE